MNELLARAGAFFVAPAETARRAAPVVAPPAPAPACAAVLASPADALGAAGAVAAALRARNHAGAAVVCSDVAAAPGAPPLPAASALARRLRQRELECSAAGRLCRVRFSGEAHELVRQTWRLRAAVDVPLVIAITRREAVHDELLAAMDLLVLAPAADADTALAELALASLQALGPPVARIDVPRSAVARAAAAAGLLPAPLPAVVGA